MCFEDRNTTSRGRSAEPDTLCRTRRCRWCRRSGRVRTLWIDRMGLLGRLGGLAGLTPDLLTHVADPLPLVRLGWSDGAQLRGHLSHELLVDAFDLHEHVVVDRDLDALGSVIRHRVRETNDELHAERLGLRLVADALNLERLREPLRHAVHPVGDERAGEPVQRFVPALVRGAPHHDGVFLERQGELRMKRAADLALRALHGDRAALELGGDALGQRNRLPADARHGGYHTTASSSPPTRAVRASRSDIKPCGVERMAIPSPFLTRGISRSLTYRRSPGAETRCSS